MEKSSSGQDTAALLGEGGLDCVGWDDLEPDGGAMDVRELAITESETGEDFLLRSTTGGGLLPGFPDLDTAQSDSEQLLGVDSKIKATPLKVWKLHQSRPLSEAPPETILHGSPTAGSRSVPWPGHQTKSCW